MIKEPARAALLTKGFYPLSTGIEIFALIHNHLDLLLWKREFHLKSNDGINLLLWSRSNWRCVFKPLIS